MRKIWVFFGLLLFHVSAISAVAQVDLGADLVNRYIWRGRDVGANLPHIHPYLYCDIKNLQVGAWGAYPLQSTPEGTHEEIDFYFTYNIPFGENSVSVGVTDYYLAKNDIGDFHDGDGAHTLELSVGYSGVVSLTGTVNFYNDQDNSMYIEFGYPREVKGVSLKFFAGAVLGKSPDWYGYEEAALANLGLTATKEIKMTENFSLPLSVSLVANPKVKTSYLVLGVSF